MHRIYISGPTEGKGWSRSFSDEESRLRGMKYDVEAPARRGANLRNRIGKLVTCDEIAMLRGWSQSEGARIERDIAMRLGMVVTGAAG